MKPDGTRSKLPKTIELPAGLLNYNAWQAWRVFGIMSENAPPIMLREDWPPP